ncbi:hypothetical protein NXY55_22735, partial [Aeromonas veronii]|nr:hypothetical protein [Aeromonas veronii]
FASCASALAIYTNCFSASDNSNACFVMGISVTFKSFRIEAAFSRNFLLLMNKLFSVEKVSSKIFSATVNCGTIAVSTS